MAEETTLDIIRMLGKVSVKELNESYFNDKILKEVEKQGIEYNRTASLTFSKSS